MSSRKKLALIAPIVSSLVPGIHTRPQLEWILRSVAARGILEITQHFRIRSAERGFSTVEAQNVLRHGMISGAPEFCPDFCNWRFLVSGEHDNGTLYIVAGVSGGDRRQVCVPHSVALITGYIR